MKNLFYQFKRVAKHLKSIIQKIMNKSLKGATSSIETCGEVVATGLTIVAIIVVSLVIVVMTLPSLLMMRAGMNQTVSIGGNA